MTKTQLSREDWIAAGFNALSARGPQALKAEALARELRTTKGSFYWHFKDLADFHASMLGRWKTSVQPEELPASTRPATALRKRAQACARAANPSIRAWARSNTQVAEAMTLIDEDNLNEITRLMTQCEVSNPELVRVLYAACMGLNDLPEAASEASENAIGTLVDLILALR